MTRANVGVSYLGTSCINEIDFRTDGFQRPSSIGDSRCSFPWFLRRAAFQGSAPLISVLRSSVTRSTLLRRIRFSLVITGFSRADKLLLDRVRIATWHDALHWQWCLLVERNFRDLMSYVSRSCQVVCYLTPTFNLFLHRSPSSYVIAKNETLHSLLRGYFFLSLSLLLLLLPLWGVHVYISDKFYFILFQCN